MWEGASYKLHLLLGVFGVFFIQFINILGSLSIRQFSKYFGPKPA